jgi:hypothetical protein
MGAGRNGRTGGNLAGQHVQSAQQVVDVPPKLSARARVFATGHGRKTDATGRYSPARSRRVIQTTPTPAHGAAMPVSAAADAHGAEPDEDVEVAIVS